jgi:hypothetical protein
LPITSDAKELNMNWRNFKRRGTLLVVLILAGAWAGVHRADAQATAPPPAADAAKAAADIDIGTPTDDGPMIITPLLEGGELKDGHHGSPLSVQEFQFDPSTRQVGLARNSPTEQRFYGNTRIDAAYYGSDLNVFDYLTADRANIGKIVLTCANKKIIIMPNYVVTPATDDTPVIDPSTYCAFVQYTKGNECNQPGTTVTLRRNTDPPAPLADGLISKINRKTDVMTWTLERGGAVIKTGAFGFPVVATEPGLVKYVIALP